MQPTNLVKPFIVICIINSLVTLFTYKLWWFEISLLVLIILSSGFIIMGITWLENIIIQTRNKDHK